MNMMLRILALFGVMIVYALLGVVMIVYADREVKKTDRVIEGEDRGE